MYTKPILHLWKHWFHSYVSYRGYKVCSYTPKRMGLNNKEHISSNCYNLCQFNSFFHYRQLHRALIVIQYEQIKWWIAKKLEETCIMHVTEFSLTPFSILWHTPHDTNFYTLIRQQYNHVYLCVYFFVCDYYNIKRTRKQMTKQRKTNNYYTGVTVAVIAIKQAMKLK